jgi:peptidoglycan biosynthesis protein MviN/MurJ (putative lipid II flippase)
MLGLVLNILLNLLLLPVLGLLGAVLATAAANAAMLALLACLSVRAGMSLDRGTLLIYLLPATLALPVPLAAALWIAVAWLSWRSELVFSSATLDEFSRVIRRYRAKVAPWTTATPIRESP